MNQVYQMAEVTKQAYHQYIKKQERQSLLLSELIEQVDAIRKEHPGCGLEKMYRYIQPNWIGRDKFIATFQELGYSVKKNKNYQKTTFPVHTQFVNLITGLRVQDQNRVWQTDITYYLVNDKFYYIIFIIDIYTKVIKGYNVSYHMRAEANITALKMAIKSTKETLKDLIHHSDRGGQYIDKEYQDLLIKREIHISMGDCAQDNAYAERINGTIKNEYLKYQHIDSFRALKKAVKKAVKHYNEKRIHNYLPGNQSPIKFENSLVGLSDQERPMVIVYAEGNCKIREASSLPYFRPREEPQAHDCPIVINK